MPDSTLNAMLSQLRRSYTESLPVKLDAMKQAAEKLDFAELARLGHQLKGSGRSYGLAEVSELGARIEQAAHDRRYALLDPILIEFRALIQHLSDATVPAEKP